MKNSAVHWFGRAYVRPGFTLKESQAYARAVRKIIKEHGLKPVGRTGVKNFEPNGFTMFVMLCESHVALHTWIERGYVDFEVFVCNVSRDNTQSARQVFDKIGALFEPMKVRRQLANR